MKLALRFGLAALATLALAGVASAAGPLRIVEAGGSGYPDRSYILSLPSPKSLSRSEVSVTENGQRVANEQLARQGSAASQSAVVLAIDASDSMSGRPIRDAVAAARAFAARMNAQEQVAVVTFNNDVHVVQKFTTNKADVEAALSSIPQLANGTKINDALDQSLKLIQPSGAAGAAILLLSDGTDVGSTATASSVMQELRAQHVRVFSIGLVTHSFDKQALQALASTSGGAFVEASGPAQLKPIYETLGKQLLASEYLLSYRSRQNPNTKVNVRVAVAGVPGAAVAEYTTPALHLAPPQPYNPTTYDRVIQSPWAMLGVALLFAVLIGFAVSRITSRRPEKLVDRVGDFVSIQQQRKVESESKKQRQSPRQLLTKMQSSASGARWFDRLGTTLELADVRAEPIQVVILTVMGTLLAMLILGYAVGVFGVIAALSVPFIVRAWLMNRVAKKRRAFAEQLPDNLDVLASSLRAGHSLVGALAVVADDAVEPSKTEFRRVLNEEQFGAPLEDAFGVVVQRMENQDLDQVALIARLQREVGSNSAEVLDRVIDAVRARMELRRLVRTLTAQGRLSRWILTLLPITIAVGLTLIDHSYMAPLYHETGGKLLLILAGCMVALGSWIIGKIVDIQV